MSIKFDRNNSCSKIQEGAVAGIEMAEPPSTRLQNMLKTAVQTVQWTYSLFWQMCPQQGMLVWGDGYYNGAIKTRKTVQPMEVSTEEASLQRSKQLMELYESLSAGDQSNHQTRRPCASLSPEDLTESEWFYLMCVSFSFPPGVGLPGKAYSKRKQVWLAGANEVDSKFFTRAILAKSAGIQTVVCIPLLDGVVELGTTERVQEDVGLVQQVKKIFIDHDPPPQPPKPAPSEHSTSNYSPPLPLVDPPAAANQIHDEEGEEGEEEEEEDEEEEEEEEEEEAEFDSEANTGRLTATLDLATAPLATEPSELMQLEMSEDIRLGSPDDDCDFQLLDPRQAANPEDDHPRDDSFRAESTSRWELSEDPLSLLTSSLPPPPSEPGGFPTEELVEDDTRYSQTVSTVLQQQWSPPPSIGPYPMYYSQSAFSRWTVRSTDDHHLLRVSGDGTSQWLLKYIIFSVPFLHTKYNDETSPKSRDASESASRFRKGTPQDDIGANHVLAERRRREKLNERFIVLRSLVPFVTKMDKASILGDTIEYLKQLRKKIQDLESRNHQMEIDRSRALPDPQRSEVTAVARLGGPSLGSVKKKLKIVEGTSGPRLKAVDLQLSPPPPQLQPEEGVGVQVQVSIIESDALVELQCPYREGLLLDVMVVLRELRVEVTAVQSSLTSEVFVAELRAKVKENATGKKPSITEVKKAVHQIIPQS